MLKTNAIADAQKEHWNKVIVKEFISSEESGEEEIDEEKRQVLMIKPLRWRAPKIDRFFKQLDRKALKKKSKQSKQQTMLDLILHDQSPLITNFLDLLQLNTWTNHYGTLTIIFH